MRSWSWSWSWSPLVLLFALACEAPRAAAPAPQTARAAEVPAARGPAAPEAAEAEVTGAAPRQEPAAAAPAADPPAGDRPDAPALALAPEQKAALEAVAEERNYNKPVEHYTVSNEYRHDLWFPFLQGLGGAYVGVASDQNYTLIAAARSEVAFLIDLDRQVVDLHAIYQALIEAAPDPAAFLAYFGAGAGARRSAQATLTAGLRGLEKDRARALEFFAAQREVLAAYLHNVRDEQRGSWLNDPQAYAYVRAMFQAGRIRILQGNLAGRASMPAIADSARALGLSIRVLYLSNAEEYLFYTDRYADNVRDLPTDARGVVLRTIHDRFEGWESCGEGDKRWNYQVQTLTDYQQRLGARGPGRNQDRTTMLALAQGEGAVQRKARGVSVVGAL